MKSEYETLIENLDQTLLMLKDYWLESAPELKQTWLSRIDKALDERLRLMKLRDTNHQ